MENSQNKTFQIPATIAKIETLEDRSLKIKLITQELSPEQNAILFDYSQKIGWFLFKEAPIQEKDILGLPKIEDDFSRKSYSERLAAVIWRLCEKTKGRKPTADEAKKYYESYMEKLIEQIKEKLT